MTDIALYNILRKVDGVTDAEAKEAVTNIASSKEIATKADIKDMATKADIKDMATKEYIKAEIAKLETRLTRQMYAVAGIIIAAVGLMIKFFN